MWAIGSVIIYIHSNYTGNQVSEVTRTCGDTKLDIGGCANQVLYLLGQWKHGSRTVKVDNTKSTLAFNRLAYIFYFQPNINRTIEM